MKIPPW